MSSNQFPTATVVVCTRNRAADLDHCLRHISELRYRGFRVLVVDSASTDTTHEVAHAHRTDYVRVSAPGLSRARNEGARNVSTEIVAYIDDDAIPAPDWLSALAVEFADPDVMAVAGHIQTFDLNEIPGGLERLIIDKSTPGWLSIAGFGGIGEGCNMAFRRSAFAHWPGFDERLGRGAPIHSAEEHHAFLSLAALGYKCVYTPRAVVRHGTKPTHAMMKANYEASVAYALLLFKERPELRGLLFEHFTRARSEGVRSWQQHRQPAIGEQLSKTAKLSATVSGAKLFVKAVGIKISKDPLLTAESLTF